MIEIPIKLLKIITILLEVKYKKQRDIYFNKDLKWTH